MQRTLLAAFAACALALTLPASALAQATPVEPTPSSSPNFLLAGATPDLDQIGYVDTVSMTRAGDRVAVWSIWIWLDRPMVDGKRVAYVMRRNVYDCGARTGVQEHLTVYTDDRTVIFSGPPSDNPRFEPIGPGTIGEGILTFVCGGAAPHPSREPASNIQDAVEKGRALGAMLKEEKSS